MSRHKNKSDKPGNCIVCGKQFSIYLPCYIKDGFVKCNKCRNKERYLQIKKFDILKRDNFQCVYCGNSPISECVRLEVDHIIPVSLGGTHHIDNLATACFDCNRSKKSTYNELNYLKIIEIIKKRNLEIQNKLIFKKELGE